MRNALLALAFALAATPAFADDAPTCAIERPVNAKLVADANDLKGVSGRTDMLIGNLSYMRAPEEEAEAASGAVLFIRRPDSTWRAIVPPISAAAMLSRKLESTNTMIKRTKPPFQSSGRILGSTTGTWLFSK